MTKSYITVIVLLLTVACKHRVSVVQDDSSPIQKFGESFQDQVIFTDPAGVVWNVAIDYQDRGALVVSKADLTSMNLEYFLIEFSERAITKWTHETVRGDFPRGYADTQGTPAAPVKVLANTLEFVEAQTGSVISSDLRSEADIKQALSTQFALFEALIGLSSKPQAKAIVSSVEGREIDVARLHLVTSIDGLTSERVAIAAKPTKPNISFDNAVGSYLASRTIQTNHYNPNSTHYTLAIHYRKNQDGTVFSLRDDASNTSYILERIQKSTQGNLFFDVAGPTNRLHYALQGQAGSDYLMLDTAASQEVAEHFLALKKIVGGVSDSPNILDFIDDYLEIFGPYRAVNFAELAQGKAHDSSARGPGQPAADSSSDEADAADGRSGNADPRGGAPLPSDAASGSRGAR